MTDQASDFDAIRSLYPSLPSHEDYPMRSFRIEGQAGSLPTVWIEFDVAGDVLARIDEEATP